VTDRQLAASALAAAESKYRLLAENATDVVILISPTWQLTWVSPATQQVLGYEPAELVGTDTKDLIHPEDLTVLATLRSPINQGDVRVHYELRVRNAAGEYRWMSGVSRLAFDADGNAVGRISTLRDIHEQVLAQRALARSEHMFRLAMDGAPQGMAVVGLHLAFLQVNAALCSLLGRDEQWLLSHTVRDVIHPDDVEDDLTGRDELLEGRSSSRIRECRWLAADGSVIWVLQSTGLLRDEQAMPLFYVSHIQDNTDVHRKNADLVFRANHDALTGLVNRGQLQDLLEGVLLGGRRIGGVPGLLFCDLDHFKEVNDTLGHGAGDEVLKITSERIAGVLRASDIVARIGGDEFIAVLPQVRDSRAAAIIGEKIRAAVAQPMVLGGGAAEISITMSIGLALATRNTSAEQLLLNADRALYEAKQAGRDRIVSFADRAR
ncbi:MAG: diguanylate cyclase, partial [Actinomycetes bacterium]